MRGAAGLVLLVAVGCQDQPPVRTLRAAATESGDLVWLVGGLRAGESLDALRHNGWHSLAQEGDRWWSTDTSHFYRVSRGGVPTLQAQPEPLALEWVTDDPSGLQNAGETLALQLDLPLQELSGLPLRLELTREPEGLWLGPEGWTADPVTWAELQADAGVLASRVDLAVPPWADEPTLATLTATLALQSDPSRPLIHTPFQVHETAVSPAWGDLHDHTGLSNDGCEDALAECVPRGLLPANDTFDQAFANRLDFAAMTDHAEYDQVISRDKSRSLALWDSALAVMAQPQPVVALLGYEWTGFYSGGGHRTVIFAGPDPQACLRPGAALKDPYLRYNGEVFTPSSYAITTPLELQDLLRGLVPKGCTPMRAIAYFHHPAMSRPRAVHWQEPLNQGLDDTVVEIYSEHGSSECRDVSEGPCTWRTRAALYDPRGSVQSALLSGWRLGFVGGTDNHEGRAGDLSTPSLHVTSREAQMQYTTGGLTQVLAAPGPLDADAVFDAIDRRHTWASSWRFDTLDLAAAGNDGHLYLPGDTVPATAAPLQVVARVAADGLDQVTVELVRADGVVLASGRPDEGPLELPWTASLPVYGRVRVSLGDRTERAWSSPFFPELP